MSILHPKKAPRQPSVADEFKRFVADYGLNEPGALIHANAIVEDAWRFARSTASSAGVLQQPEGVEPAVPFTDDNEFAAYKRVCEKIGFAPPVLVSAEIRAFMRDKGMKEYDLDRVQAFMAKKAQQAGVEFYWCALRQSDTEVVFSLAGRYPYDKAIPLRVLARVEQFIERFGDAVAFLVTDYRAKQPDPFIGVRARSDGELIVFDVWDEPSFK